MRYIELDRRREAVISQQANTYIGGVASTINTRSALAAKLGINTGDIPYFEVVGNNVKANITKNYNTPQHFEKSIITHYEDLGGRVGVAGNYYTTAPNLKYLSFPNATSIGDYYARLAQGNTLKVIKLDNITYLSGLQLYWNQYINLNVFYIPKCTNIGGTPNDDGGFYDFYNVKRFYVHPSQETINNGQPDGNLVHFRDTQGSEIHYVQNYTKPTSITDLDATLISDTATLTFTAPNSTNALDFYEVYVNGFYNKEITGSGGSVSGVSTGDKITVYARDIYYNGSISNEITIA
jgi:hypothetical protein